MSMLLAAGALMPFASFLPFARRRFPLIMIFSSNPWMMGLGVILFICWLVFNNSGNA